MNIASLVMRRTGGRKQGVALSTAAYAIASLSGFLGGELSYSKGVGVNHEAWDTPPEEFTPTIGVDKLEDEKPVRAEAGDISVVLVKRGETIYALDATCTHAGGPLDEGTVEGDAIICPWHGSKFCLADGSVLRSPATEPAISLETRVRDGTIEVRRRDA
jgi:nitrite reductase/ring-hydroxylating ferredoxin subunit